MSFKLILKFNDNVVSEFPLEQEQTIIGRKPSNDIPIDNLAVSGTHARIIKIGNKIIFEDLGSTNGTMINDKQATKQILKHGDNIQIGKHTLVLVDSNGPEIQAQPAPEEDEMEKTMIISPQAKSAMMEKAGVATKPANALPLGAIQIISGPGAGKSMDLTASLTSVGKGDNCRIKVKGFTIGKQAAAITRRPTGYHFAYIEGMSKPKLNGESVGSQPHTLKDGDIIELGDLKMEFFLKEE